MLKTGMIGGPSIVFCRYAEAGVSKIRSHIYRGADAQICRSVQGLDANSLYLFCSGQETPCGKEKVFHCDPRERSESEAEIIQNVLNDKLFGFFSSRHRSSRAKQRSRAIAEALFRILPSFRDFRSSRGPDTATYARL